MARSLSSQEEKITQGSLEAVEGVISADLPELGASLYDRDFCQWIAVTVDLLQENKFTEVDLEHLIEEIADMAKSEKNALKSNLRVVLMHLLKYKYQPRRRSRSWLVTLREHRLRLREALRNSPSLKPYLLQVFAETYEDSRKLAADETGLALDKFPQITIFTPEQALDGDFLPE